MKKLHPFSTQIFKKNEDSLQTGKSDEREDDHLREKYVYINILSFVSDQA